MLQELKIVIAMKAIITPIIADIKVRINVSVEKRVFTNFFPAPIARIVPISLVLSITLTVIVFIMIMNTTIARIIIKILKTKPIPSTEPE